MKIKKDVVEQIIKEEAMKVKKLMILKEEKQNILKQLNELYEEEDSMSEAVLEEGINWENRQEVEDALLASYKEKADKMKMKMPTWQVKGNASFNMAVDAAIKFKTLDVAYNKGKKAFQPLTYNTSSLRGFKFEEKA